MMSRQDRELLRPFMHGNPGVIVATRPTMCPPSCKHNCHNCTPQKRRDITWNAEL